LPEYIQTVALLEKGIGVHHSGVIPILREITEILFSKGCVKLLLATETFSVGLNMPIKTTVFTGLSKFDGIETRWFHSHEYTQAAGRAGRRGIDTVGTVIHLPNLFRMPELTEYRAILSGRPQSLTSKFKISYSLLLHRVDAMVSSPEPITLESFFAASMAHVETARRLAAIREEITATGEQMEQQKSRLGQGMGRTPIDVLARYQYLTEHSKTMVNKKRKEMEREMQQIRDTYKFLEADKMQYVLYEDKRIKLEKVQREYNETENAMLAGVQRGLSLLETDGFLEQEGGVSLKGSIAVNLREVHCLVFAEWIHTKRLSSMTAVQLAILFSCFTNIVVAEEFQTYSVPVEDMVETIVDIKMALERYRDLENRESLDTGIDYSLHFDLVVHIKDWMMASTVQECKMVLTRLETEKGIFLGEFVKAVLKINAISCEIEQVAERLGDMELCSRCKEIPKQTLKYVATNQSLYV